MKRKVKFTLSLEGAIVSDRLIDSIEIAWKEDLKEEDILQLSYYWVSQRNLLTSTFSGLRTYKQSTLTIEPLDSFGNGPEAVQKPFRSEQTRHKVKFTIVLKDATIDGIYHKTAKAEWEKLVTEQEACDTGFNFVNDSGFEHSMVAEKFPSLSNYTACKIIMEPLD